MTRLFHISDIHFGLEDRRALDWVAQCIAREKPDAVSITGDLTMRARHREYAAAVDWIKSLNVPVTVEVGNHDLPYFNLIERFIDPYRRFDAIQSLIEREIDLPGVAIVPLKTTARAQWRLNWSKGRVGNRDLDEALSDLERHRARPLKLVTCHHPLVDADTEGSGSTRGGKRALAALARAGADAVLSGHVHDPFDLMVEADGFPIRLIGAGTLSQRLRATRPSYNRLEWSAEGGLKVCQRTA